MEYNFKLTIEEYSAVLKFITELDKGKVFMKKLMDKSVIALCIIVAIAVWIILGFYQFLYFIVIAGLMVSIYFFFSTPKQLDKRRVKLVKKVVRKKPDILGMQSIKITKDEISYHYNNICLTSNLADISRLIEHNKVIIVVGSNDNIVGVIPYSCFHSEKDKQQLKNKLLSKQNCN